MKRIPPRAECTVYRILFESPPKDYTMIAFKERIIKNVRD